MAFRAARPVFAGIPEFRRELKNASRNIRRAIGKANRRAAKHVEPKVRTRYRQVYPNSSRSVRGITGRASQRRAAISFNLNSEPELMGREFGGRKRPTTQQFLPHRGKQGYFLYPTLREETDEIVEFYADAWSQELRKAFPGHIGRAFLR